MFRSPVVVGGGTPFLPPVTGDVRLDLVETRTFGSCVIYERFGRARDESDYTSAVGRCPTRWVLRTMERPQVGVAMVVLSMSVVVGRGSGVMGGAGS